MKKIKVEVLVLKAKISTIALGNWKRKTAAPPKFPVDVPFFLMSPLNMAFLKEVTQNIHENQQESHEQIKTKHNTLKRNPFVV